MFLLLLSFFLNSAWHLDTGCHYTEGPVLHPFAFRVHAHSLGKFISVAKYYAIFLNFSQLLSPWQSCFPLSLLPSTIPLLPPVLLDSPLSPSSNRTKRREPQYKKQQELGVKGMGCGRFKAPCPLPTTSPPHSKGQYSPGDSVDIG